MAALISGLTAGLAIRSRETSGTAGVGAGAEGGTAVGTPWGRGGPADGAAGTVGGGTGSIGSVGTWGMIGGTQDCTLMETRSSTRLGGGMSLASAKFMVSMDWKYTPSRSCTEQRNCAAMGAESLKSSERWMVMELQLLWKAS